MQREKGIAAHYAVKWSIHVSAGYKYENTNLDVQCR